MALELMVGDAGLPLVGQLLRTASRGDVNLKIRMILMKDFHQFLAQSPVASCNEDILGCLHFSEC